MSKSFVVDNDLSVDWYIRLANVLIDIVAIYILAFVLFIFIYILAGLGLDGLGLWLEGLSDRDFNLLGVGLMMAYYMIMEITTQRTVGKLITGTIVISEDGSKPEAKSIIGRSLCRIFTIEALSFLRAYPRGWHDSASGTYVVKVKKYKEIMDVLNVKDSIDHIGIQEI
ncbi:RDD family protein [Flavobacterium sp. AG291]|uniref:RDD family protein n=1 Tax=Flavobacterium sp. AG291 TaxID=2184000 RepID=UPI000E0A5D68|nr:RDD family protein [Flavobacterium sp. AG291]RDI06773.1 putative RDD family membrane protein YckC [Flavobacterium sp. AG291]